MNGLVQLNIEVYSEIILIFLFCFYYRCISFLAYTQSCVCYFYMHVSADYVACKWRNSPFVTLISNKCSDALQQN